MGSQIGKIKVVVFYLAGKKSLGKTNTIKFW